MPLSPEAEGAAVALDALPDHEKRLVIAQTLEANPDFLPHHEATRARLWTVVLVGLFTVAVISVIAGVILILNGRDSAPAFVVVVAVVAGVIGLFARSPAA